MTSSTNATLQPLNCDRDAVRWAREFNDRLKEIYGLAPLDEGWLVVWFANAMMCGEDTYRWRQEAKSLPSASTPTSDAVRDALIDLVRLKDLKQWIEAGLPGADEATKADARTRYEREKEPAWEAARLALEAHSAKARCICPTNAVDANCPALHEEMKSASAPSASTATSGHIIADKATDAQKHRAFEWLRSIALGEEKHDPKDSRRGLAALAFDEWHRLATQSASAPSASTATSGETPRTNAAWKKHFPKDGERLMSFAYAIADTARQLERELSEAKQDALRMFRELAAEHQANHSASAPSAITAISGAQTPRLDALLREIKPHEGDPLWKDTERLIDFAKTLEIEHQNMRRLLYGMQSASAPSATTLAEPCQRHGCRFHVAQDLLHLAQERGELAETEISSVTSSATASPEVAAQDAEAVEIAREYLSLERTLISGEDISQLCRALVRRADSSASKESPYDDPLFIAVNAVHEKEERQRMHDEGVRDGVHPPVPPKHKPVA